MLRARDQFWIDILDCGILDLHFFYGILEKIEENDLYFDAEQTILEYWDMNVNIFIAEALYILAEWFLKKYKYKIEELLNIWDLERFREENELYETFINALDSHLWFYDEKIEHLFENSEFYYR